MRTMNPSKPLPHTQPPARPALLRHSDQQPLTIAVTRPEGQQEPLMAALQQAGARPYHIPLLAIEEREETPEERSTLLDLDHCSKVICVSPVTAHIFLDRLDQYWPQPPVKTLWVTPGAGTAAILEEYGLPVVCPQDGDNSEAMLQLPALTEVAGEKILLCKGEGGRQLLKSTLQERGAQVKELFLYRRICPPMLSAERELLQSGYFDVILISSLDALNNLIQLTGSEPDLLSTPLLVSSPRLRQEARALGFRTIVQAKGAAADWQLAALESIARQR